MTCIEKLRELHPEWDEAAINDCVMNHCPFEYMYTSEHFNCSPPGSCGWCWNEVYIEPVPHEFEFWWRDTLEVNGEVVESMYTKMHMTVLERIKQRYTGELVYRIRRQSEEGWIDEDFYTEKEVREMLEARIK